MEIRRELKLVASIGLSGAFLMLIAKVWSAAKVEWHGLDSWFNLLPHYFEEIGIAMVIASIIGLTIDLSARRREESRHQKQLKDIQDNVFRSAFGIRIQNAVLDELYETVFAIKF